MPRTGSDGASRYRSGGAPELAGRVVLLAGLAAYIAAVYSAVVLGGGALLGAEAPNTALSVLAMSVVALTFERVRVRAQRLADRLGRGERATPFEVLSGFAELASRSYRHETVLPRMAALMAAGTGAVRAEVWLRVGSELLLGAAWPGADAPARRIDLPADRLPSIPASDHSVAVRDGDELLGMVSIAKRAGESPTPGDLRLMDEVASQAGFLLRNVGLTAQLTARLDELSRVAAAIRASRRRIVETQDRERRRLERDIHDGAQQHLVALAVKLRMARSMAERDPARARTMIGEVRELTGAALENLRDLTRGIYPPTLVENGVADALRDHVGRSGAPVKITTKGRGRSDPAAETVAYFTVLEAIQNASKHAPGCTVRVVLERAADALMFTVADEGPGFDPSAVARGSGLQNMEDRLAVVGGNLEFRSAPGEGTVVRGRIPILTAGGAR